jgi:hypothetical protein
MALLTCSRAQHLAKIGPFLAPASSNGANGMSDPAFLFWTRLFGGGAEEDAAHLALGEIEYDAAVDGTHDKGAGIA